MGLIINMNEALKLRTDYNVLREPLNDMLRNRQELWEKQNPLDLLYNRGTLDGFQETYTSSIGFKEVFGESGESGTGSLSKPHEGYSATFTSRTFRGEFAITKQVLEDGRKGQVKDTASKWMAAWHRGIVYYGLTAIASGLGGPALIFKGRGGDSRLSLKAYDSPDGDIYNPVKNPLFGKHTIVKTEEMSSSDITAAIQYNKFMPSETVDFTKAQDVAKLADYIYQVITYMQNYTDDNGQRIANDGKYTIVMPNDARLKQAVAAALTANNFNDIGVSIGVNKAYGIAETAETSYLLDMQGTDAGQGFYLVNKSYNAENHGPEITERIPLYLRVLEERNEDITYMGRQRFDVNAAEWRGIAYVSLNNYDSTSGPSGSWNDSTTFKTMTLLSTLAKPVVVTEPIPEVPEATEASTDN